MKNNNLRRIAMRKEHRKRAKKVVTEMTFFPLNADPITFKDGVVFMGGIRSGRAHACSIYDQAFKEWIIDFVEPKDTERLNPYIFTFDGVNKKRLSN